MALPNPTVTITPAIPNTPSSIRPPLYDEIDKLPSFTSSFEILFDPKNHPASTKPKSRSQIHHLLLAGDAKARQVITNTRAKVGEFVTGNPSVGQIIASARVKVEETQVRLQPYYEDMWAGHQMIMEEARGLSPAVFAVILASLGLLLTVLVVQVCKWLFRM